VVGKLIGPQKIEKRTEKSAKICARVCKSGEKAKLKE